MLRQNNFITLQSINPWSGVLSFSELHIHRSINLFNRLHQPPVVPEFTLSAICYCPHYQATECLCSVFVTISGLIFNPETLCIIGLHQNNNVIVYHKLLMVMLVRLTYSQDSLTD